MKRKLKLIVELEYDADDIWYKSNENDIVSIEEMCEKDEFNFNDDYNILFDFINNSDNELLISVVPAE